MITTADYLNKLIAQKKSLVDNLIEKGIEATYDETLETLVPKVLDIENGGSTPSNISFSSYGLFEYPENVVIPNNVTSLSNSERCFKGHTEIVSVSFESDSQLSGVTDYSFSGCTNLQKIDFSNANKSTVSTRFTLNNYAFQGCTNLTDIIFNDNTWIFFNYGTAAFQNCKSLTDNIVNEFLKIPIRGLNNVSLTAGNLFDGCTGLINIIIPEGYTIISASRLFGNCTSLETISFPSTLITFNSSNLFAGCSKLKSITFKGVLTSGTYISAANANCPFYGLTALEEVILPEGWNLSICISTGATNFTNILTHDGMVMMFNNLATVETATLILGATNLSRLTEEEKAIATNKGWTLA